MHGPMPHHPLAAAAQEVRAVARETRWPWLERAALGLMAASAALTTVISGIQIRQLLRREIREEQREQERERRQAEATAPPPSRPAQGVMASAEIPPHGQGGEERRWTRREEHAEAATHTRHQR